MKTRRSFIAVVAGLSLLFFISLPPSNALTLAAFPNKGGLPYPEDPEGTVFLKQASVFLEAQSRWGSIEGYPPWHSVGVNQTAFYVLENPGTQKTLNVTFPMLTSHTAAGNGLAFKVDGIAMNYSGMRWVQVLDKDGLCCLDSLELYWLTLSIPTGGRTNVTVQTLQVGATGRTALYKFFMSNASRWAAPMESLLFFFHIAGGALTSLTIPPSANTTSIAIWSMMNQIPSQDLGISWTITEPEPPFRPFSNNNPDPFIATGVVVGVVGVAAAAVLYVKKRTPRTIEMSEAQLASEPV